MVFQFWVLPKHVILEMLTDSIFEGSIRSNSCTDEGFTNMNFHTNFKLFLYPHLFFKSDDCDDDDDDVCET
jgi:hypothetical protein